MWGQQEVCQLDDFDICIGSEHAHPEYCNRFIQCIAKEDLTCEELHMKCPHGYVYDALLCSSPIFAATCPGKNNSYNAF